MEGTVRDVVIVEFDFNSVITCMEKKDTDILFTHHCRHNQVMHKISTSSFTDDDIAKIDVA